MQELRRVRLGVLDNVFGKEGKPILGMTTPAKLTAGLEPLTPMEEDSDLAGSDDHNNGKKQKDKKDIELMGSAVGDSQTPARKIKRRRKRRTRC